MVILTVLICVRVGGFLWALSDTNKDDEEDDDDCYTSYKIGKLLKRGTEKTKCEKFLKICFG